MEINLKLTISFLLLAAFMLLSVGCDGESQIGDTPTPFSPQDTATQSRELPTLSSSLNSVPSSSASAITTPPTDSEGINSLHATLRQEEGQIRFGTHADPNVVTLGPVSGGSPSYPPYSGKNSMNIKMPERTPVLAPTDMTMVGYTNRSAEYRDDTGDHQSPFDDLELCFESATSDWPGMIVCVYHLSTSPLLLGHDQDPACATVQRWDPLSPGQAEGWLYFEDNDAFYRADGSSSATARDARPCRGQIGRAVQRGDVIGYSGRVGDHPHAAFRFKVQHETVNSLVRRGDRHLHWVQPASFFYWRCHQLGVEFPSGVLAYPFECEGYRLPAEQREVSFKYPPN